VFATEEAEELVASAPDAATALAWAGRREAGEPFAGVVQYIGDGDSLCVGRTADPEEWIEVRLADFNAPELHQPGGVAAKAALERIALHHAVVCTTERGRGSRVVSYDRVIARCQIGADSIGELLRHAGVAEGGN
jgi:endonuclease YncB( thermonuclease family)